MTTTTSRATYDTLSEGTEAPPFVAENLTRTDFVKYAGASGDFNPIHHDEGYAQRAGNPSVFGHGMLTAGLMGHLLSDWLGVAALRRYKVRFTSRVWPGDTLTCGARVVRKYRDEASGENRVDLECWVRNQNGETVLTGEATGGWKG